METEGDYLRISEIRIMVGPVTTTVFGSIVAYRVAATCWALKKYHPMTNEEFLTALAEVQESQRRFSTNLVLSTD